MHFCALEAMGRFFRLLFASFAMLASVGACAQALYAVSVRTYSDPGYHGVEGNLYLVDPETAQTRLVSSLNVGGKTPVGLDGLAIHPRTGVFYGITAPTSAVIPKSLVIVDPSNGNVTLVGDLGPVASDIEFSADGTLFAWLPQTRQIGTVDLDSGRITPRGKPIERGASKGGFTLVGQNKAYVATTGGAGTIDVIDINTGELTAGPQLAGAPFPDLINGLAYQRGILYGINTNFGRSTQANLVSIDPLTGKVTNIGALPNDTDAIAFGPAQTTRDMTASLLEWRVPILIGLGVFALGVILFAMRSSGPPQA
jgi:outer membrane protein assembly factor BamB